MFSKITLSSKLTIALLVLSLALFGQLKFKQWKSQKAIEAEKENLYRQQQQLSKKNEDVNASLEFLKSADFKEKVARQQLNLKREGEVVYTFSEYQEAGAGQASAASPSKGSNIRKWWDYFFTSL
jgi:cell division protein FtsB